MAMERVTVEQNGERFTLEVPEGTSDEQIKSFLAQQQSTAGGLTQPAPNPAENVGTYAAQAAMTPAFGGPNLTNVPPTGMTGPVRPGATINPGIIPYVAEDLAGVGKTLATNATLGHALDLIKKEGLTGAGAEFAKAVLHPFTQQTLSGAAKNIAGGVAQGVMAPENLLTLPYNMAAYEQAKIRANPYAPEYKTNPYAQVVRGEAPTQAVAGAANAQRALINQQYGGLTPQEQAILQQDRQRQMAIQQKKQQARQVLSQPPTAQNFIERSKAMAELYGDVGQQ